MTRPHTTHYESCGCCEAERDALKAQVESMREAGNALPLDGDALDRAEGHVVAVGFVRAGLVDDLLAQSRAALALDAERDALKAEVASLRETNAKLNRRAQASEASALRVAQIEQRIAEHKRGKPLGRIEAQFAVAAAETDRDALKAQVERLREAATRALDAIAGANSMAAYDALKRALAERAPEVER